MFTIGIDIGSVAAKAVAYDGTQIVGMEMLPTGWSPRETGSRLLEALIREGKLDQNCILSITATGYGRISLPFMADKVTEITCHAKGASFLNNGIRTVIDIGGQDSKVIKVDARGRVLDFIMNDKCAAGTGRFLQVMGNILELEVDQLAELAKNSIPLQVNSMCTVFAESEVISLLAEGKDKSVIAAGILESVANRCFSLIGKVGIEDKVFFSGGVSNNSYIKEYIGKKLGVEVYTNPMGQYNGAIGAAIIGWEKIISRGLITL